jgi:hypothetical protein
MNLSVKKAKAWENIDVVIIIVIIIWNN